MLQREDSFAVKAIDCRPDGGMKVNALMQYLQEAAACHAEQLGFGFADMNRRNCFWVLANLRLEIAQEPRWMDRLTIRTWPSGHSRLTATREFVGAAEDGSESFRAGSEWMVLDRRTGRPQNLTRFGLNLPEAEPKALSAPLHRLKPFDGGARTCSLQVPYSALDFNGHVNNTEYVRWAMDGLSLQLGRPPQVRAVHVTFLAEAFQGDEIEVLVCPSDNGRIGILERRSRGAAATDVCVVEIAAVGAKIEA